MENFKDSILNYRRSLGLSQQQFADKANVSRMTISAIERGTPPSHDTLLKIYEAFLIPKDELLKYGVVAEAVSATQRENPWENALVKQLKEENSRLWQLLQAYLPKENFLKPTHNTLMLDFPNMHEVGQAAPMRVA